MVAEKLADVIVPMLILSLLCLADNTNVCVYSSILAPDDFYIQPWLQGAISVTQQAEPLLKQ